MQKVDWHELDVPIENGIYNRIIDGKKLCLIVQEKKVTVTSKRCPHAGADLAQGWCEDNKLVCPFHRHKFDLKTGKGDVGQGNFITIYATKYEGEAWYVGIPISWWKRLL